MILPVLVFISVSIIAESYELEMGPFEVKFDTVQSPEAMIESPVAFDDFTGYPVTFWPKDGSDKWGRILLKIQEYNSAIDVSSSALRDMIKEEAFVFSKYPIDYQTITIDDRPGEMGTIETENDETVIFAAYSPDGAGGSGKVLALISAMPPVGDQTDMFLKTLEIWNT